MDVRQRPLACKQSLLPEMLAERFNFRDLGAYRTADGRRLRPGLVFRSGSLSGMADAELQQFATFGITRVFDLRSSVERVRSPSNHGVSTWVCEHEESNADLEGLWRAQGMDRQRAVSLMTDLYRDLPEEHAEAFGVVYAHIADQGSPMLFHCAAGKDRAGVCAALLLDLLEVPRATIEQDYMATSKTSARAIVETRDSMERLGIKFVEPSAIEPILNPEPSYISAMFDAVEQRYGSTQSYAEQRMGFGKAKLDAMRAKLIQD